MQTEVISKPIYRALTGLTRETRLEIALPLAMKDLARLKLKEAVEQRELFEKRYGMDFAAFKQAWDEGRVQAAHSYDVERDFWEWEAAATDEANLREIYESLP